MIELLGIDPDISVSIMFLQEALSPWISCQPLACSVSIIQKHSHRVCCLNATKSLDVVTQQDCLRLCVDFESDYNAV